MEIIAPSGKFWIAIPIDNAIAAAKGMKDKGATVYTIGIFDGADPSADPTSYKTSDENKFMHAMSSNYPKAVSYTHLTLPTNREV